MASGLAARTDVRALLKVRSLAMRMRKAQKKFYQFRAEPGPAAALRAEAQRCEGLVDAALKVWLSPTGHTDQDVKDLVALAYLAVDCRACQKKHFSNRFNHKNRMQVMIAARQAESALDKALWPKPEQEGLGL